MLAASISNAQEHEELGMGLVIDEEAYNNIPGKPALVTRSYNGLPESHSLVQYCPKPRSQGNFGSCSAWSTGYAARTIAEAIANGWVNTDIITEEAFSPWFVYTNIRRNHNDNCSGGTAIEDALRLMKNTGITKFSEYSSECEDYVPTPIMEASERYKIDDYFTLIPYQCNDYQLKINSVKKAIANDRPVIFAMDVYKSFGDSWGKELWDGVMEGNPGGHAMCVIGYDDNMYGGAFHIQNSWGTSWGDGGRIWVKYDDFAKCAKYAFEMYVRPKTTGKNLLRGNFYIKFATGEQPSATLDTVSSAIPHYKIYGEYVSGTRYRIYITNNEPAYVYLIGSDLYNNCGKVFPPNEHVSSALVYKSNCIAIPDERFYVQMDNTVGKDYICVLYSSEKLDIDTIVEDIKNGAGDFYERLEAALGRDMVTSADVKFSQNSISFSANTRRVVLPIVAEMLHK